jgi:hypothetical protein
VCCRTRVHLIQTFGEQSIELTDTVIAARMTVLGDSNPHAPYRSPKPEAVRDSFKRGSHRWAHFFDPDKLLRSRLEEQLVSIEESARSLSCL